jgi:hypothetical protein
VVLIDGYQADEVRQAITTDNNLSEAAFGRR